MGRDLKGHELGKGIRQNKNGKYEGRYIDRFGKRQSIYANSKAEVRDKLKKIERENAEKKSVKKRYTVEQWYKEWFWVYKIPVIGPNTRTHYEGVIQRHILPEIGGKFLEDVRQIHVKNIINDLDLHGYQWETQNKVRLLIMDMFNAAIDNDYAFKNPAKGVRLKKTRPNERIVLSVDEQQEFFECAAGTFYNNFFVVAVNTGLRPGELFALTEKDLDFEKHKISVTKTLLYQKFDGDTKKTFHIGPPKTQSSVRTVPTNSAAERALKEQVRLKYHLSKKYVRTGEFSDLLFVTKFNTPLNAQITNDAIGRIVNEINLQRDVLDSFPKFAAHTFRHTFATRCIEAGVLPKTLQKYLGHATLQMTMDLYVHVSEEFKHEEIKKLDNVFPYKNHGVVPINGVKVG